MEIVEKRTIKLAWADVCEIVSTEIKNILGIQISCKAAPIEIDYWDMTLDNYRLPLPKFCLLLQAVHADLEDWEDALPEESSTLISSLGMALSEKLLSKHLGLTWEHSLILEDSLWLVGVTTL